MLGRKGSIFDILFIVTIIFIAVVVLVVALTLNTSLFGTNPSQNMTNPLTQNSAARQIAGNGALSLTVWSDALVLLYFILNLSAIILASQVKTHPVFFSVVILMLGIYLLVVNTYIMAFQQIVQTQNILPVANQYLGTWIWIFQHLGELTIFFGVLLGLVQNSRAEATA